MNTTELLAHLTAIARAFDEGLNLATLPDAERRLVQQKLIGADAALDGLVAEMALHRESKALNLSFICVDYL